MKHWDIFCTVVDNFGDIGVCWRLARQLAGEHGLAVRLWVDDLESFRRLCPEINPAIDRQRQRGVEVRRWAQPFPAADVADVVIEAFACELPETYLAAMATRQPRPAWINLEYLSAETWVETSHCLPSPHPRLPLVKHFFFPGFTAATGGLLREAGLAQRREAWLKDSANAWAKLGLPPPRPDETSISLFCYENAALPELLRAWSEGDLPIRCLVPEGRVLVQAAAWLGLPGLAPGARVQRGRLALHALPFVAQEDYDYLLWACDLNFVRGEDSFVRAQWAARPLVWHIYPQEDDAHRRKLFAFLDRYCADLPPPAAAACRALWQAWNHGSGAAAAWPDYWQQRRDFTAHAGRWATKLEGSPDLAGKLVNFIEKLV
ncbi:MAG TPA: elongation factor P maturation arginine rhamnosyltransferase EarP [Rhodocyclaceae bacterium]|nr:elongation factor P maturation arginine rhamnosyltransferase EarP [Rhodocyclaceae bacterium]